MSPLAAQESTRTELPLDELSRFMGNPARYFTQRRLKAFLSLREEEEFEDEPFTLEGLSGYLLRADMLEALLQGDDETFFKRLPLMGVLPYGAFGRLSLQQYQDQCRQLIEVLQGYALEPCGPLEVNLTIGSIALQGWLKLDTATTRLSYRIGDLSAHQKMQTWVEHLALCAQGTPKLHHLVNLAKNGKVTQHGFIIVAPDEAKTHLAQIISLLQQGLCEPIPLPSKSADAWCKSYCASKTAEDEEAAWQQAIKIYQDSSSAFSSSEVEDAYWQRYFPSLVEQRERFTQLCETIWLPMHRHLELFE